jgi:hypothetical protein
MAATLSAAATGSSAPALATAAALAAATAATLAHVGRLLVCAFDGARRAIFKWQL